MTEHGLTDEELRWAEACNMTPADYAAMKKVRTSADYDALQARKVEDAERERLKAAVREALEEREAAS